MRLAFKSIAPIDSTALEQHLTTYKVHKTTNDVIKLKQKEDPSRYLSIYKSKQNCSILETNLTDEELGDILLQMPVELSSALIKPLMDAGIKPSNLLLDAVSNKKIDLLKILLENRYDPNRFNKFKVTPLMRAVIEKNLEMVQLLLKYGAEPNQTSSGDTPLLLAAEDGDLLIARELISYKANINFINEKDDTTPLFYAAKQNHLDMVKFLVTAGANPNIKKSKDPLVAAAANYNLNMLKTLLEMHADPDLTAEGTPTVLHYCSKNDMKSFVELLLEYHASTNKIMNDGKNAFLAATQNKNTDIAKLLLQHGAYINQTDKLGKSALHYATEHEMESFVEYLVNHGANTHLKNNMGMTPLFLAVTNENPSLVKLLAANSDIDMPCNGITPLYKAVLLKNKQLVRTLLSENADPSYVCINQKTPLQQSVKQQSDDITSELIKHQSITRHSSSLINSTSHLFENYFISKPKPACEDIPLIEAWRLFIDGIKQPLEAGWLGFESREKGYLKSMCHAMAYAIEHINDDLNVDFVRNIHKIALEGVQDTNYTGRYPSDTTKPGDIRELQTSYGLYEKITTKNGITEIVDNMLGKEAHICFKVKDVPPETQHILNNTNHIINYTEPQKKLFIETLDKHLKAGNVVQIQGVINGDSKHSTSHYVKRKLESYIEQYEFDIFNAKDDVNKKIKAILAFAKHCEHMHVFIDGNGRVFYMILLNFLFMKNKLPIPLLDNVNQIAGHSLDELVPIIRKGWDNIAKLKRDNKLFDVATLDILSELPERELKYFVSSLKPLKPFFKPSELYTFAEAFSENNASLVDAMIVKNKALLSIPHCRLREYISTPDLESLKSLGKQYPTLIKTLLNHPETHGVTPLMLALNSQKDVLAYLLTFNPDLSITNADGKTLKNLATDKGHEEHLATIDAYELQLAHAMKRTHQTEPHNLMIHKVAKSDTPWHPLMFSTTPREREASPMCPAIKMDWF